jgi:hypothetical protein
MTAPFAPELLIPKNKGASAAASVAFTWRFRSVVAGDGMVTYAIRRRQMTPTVGAYEYWTGSAWGAETFIAGPVSPNLVQDGMTFSTSIAVGWTTDRVYQWSVKTRNAAAEASPYADDSLIQIHAAPSMAVTVSSTTVSRPSLAWVWSGAAGYFQKTYRLAIYPAAVRNAFGFDPSNPTFQAQAAWIMPAEKYSSTDWKATVDADMVSGTQYYYFYRTTDNSDFQSGTTATGGWVEAGNFTPAYTAVPPPSIQLIPDIANGIVNTVVRSSFNLLGDNSSIFSTGIDNWVGTLNCEPSWGGPGNQKLVVTAGGMSYAALDASVTTFTAEDAAYATFAAQKAAQAAPVGTSRVMSGDQAGERIAVAPSIQYSAICTVQNKVATSRTGKLGIRWYKADNSPSAITVISQGTGVTLGQNTDTFVSVQGVTSPSDAAFAALEFEWTTSAVGDVLWIDDVAFASTASISWSPSGQNFDISFVLERSTDQVTWVPVWGMSKASPKVSDSGAVTQATTVDRAVPLGTGTIFYRAYAISKFTTNPTWSGLASNSIPGMDPAKSWIRRTSRSDHDVRVVTNQLSISKDLKHEVVEAEAQLTPIVNFSNTPKTETISISLMSLDKASFELINEALSADETLYLQTNLDGYGYYIRLVDAYQRSQRRSVAGGGFSTVRNVFDISFSAVVVGAFV